MDIIVLLMLLLSAVFISSALSQLFPHISTQLIQICLGIVIAFTAGTQIRISLDPELFLVLFIAPLLYLEAKEADKLSLWKRKRPILSLAVGLALTIMLVTGLVTNLLIPSIPLAVAFALGAALGPTDAVAVASMKSRANITNRQDSLLKGEALFNDASGIVAFQFAVAAALTGTFSLLEASLAFVIEFFGGLLVGGVMGLAFRLITRKARSMGIEDTTFHVLFEVLTPFLVYMAAHAVGASGIIAVVVAGLIDVISPKATTPSASRTALVSNSVWRVLSYGLNGIVFVLLGTQLPLAMQSTWDSVSINNGVLMLYVALLSAIVINVRFLWCYVMEALHFRKEGGFKRVSLRETLVTTLAGPKGTITLAIMFTLPITIQNADGSLAGFPQRDLVIFLACGVILITLLLATFLVPTLAHKPEPSLSQRKLLEAQARVEILRNVIEALAENETKETRKATATVINSYKTRIEAIKDSSDLDIDTETTALKIMALQWESDYVMRMVREGKSDPAVSYSYLERIKHREKLLGKSANRLHRNTMANLIRIFMIAVRRSKEIAFEILRAEEHADRAAEIRSLQHGANKYAYKQLQALIGDSCFTNEDIAEVMSEYRLVIDRLNTMIPSITNVVSPNLHENDVRRAAYRYELEEIQDMLDKERISRSLAQKLRENVLIMGMELGDVNASASATMGNLTSTR